MATELGLVGRKEVVVRLHGARQLGLQLAAHARRAHLENKTRVTAKRNLKWSIITGLEVRGVQGTDIFSRQI